MNTVSNNTENRPKPNLVGSPKIESKSSANRKCLCELNL